MTCGSRSTLGLIQSRPSSTRRRRARPSRCVVLLFLSLSLSLSASTLERTADPCSSSQRTLYGPNQYPSFVPSLEPALRHWHALCTTISSVLLALLAESLTPDPDRLTDLFTTSAARPHEPAYSRMKVVRYPPVREGEDEDEGALGVGAHKDGGALTLLAQDATGGLQVQLWDGEWVGVEPRGYELVVNVGQVVCVALSLSALSLALSR